MDRRDEQCRKWNEEFLALQRLKNQSQTDSSIVPTYAERMMKEIVYKESEKKRNEARFGKAHYCKHESKWISNQEVPCTSCSQERESQNLNWKGAQWREPLAKAMVEMTGVPTTQEQYDATQKKDSRRVGEAPRKTILEYPIRGKVEK